ncbi:hypothetical protein HU200_065947 [Digitaria exilis]|uniref:Uncharacterized protein n=1 Tax=Digitaria exilis TaxID=1010633 RepID=A0A835DX27_9POAL|nr:hypothetical protein HU200_065947 [Digitaria exilis]
MLPRDQFADTFTVEEIVDTTTTLNQQQPSEPSRSDLPIGEKGHEQDRGLELIEGFDWSDDELRAATDRLVMQLNHRLPDYDDEDFWAPLDEDQLRELKIRLPLYRIRAHEALEEQGYCRWYELDFEWYFDPELCEHVGFEDYQRLVLRNNGEYDQWEYYRKTHSTLQGDQEYVQFWEKLSSETMWIEDALNASSTAINFKEALEQVFDKGVPPSCLLEMQLELQKQHLMTPGPVTYNVSEDKARMLIRKDVEIFVSRHKTYYDYAKNKLDIAEKIGLVVPTKVC